MAERFARRIPEPTVVRLPLYQRVLGELSVDGIPTVSSAELADAAGVNAAKVRKDLSHLGTYGTPGTGYDVNFLLGQIRHELGLDREWQVVIVGMGNLGHALAHSQRFSTQNFRTFALFDIDPAKIGEDCRRHSSPASLGAFDALAGMSQADRRHRLPRRSSPRRVQPSRSGEE